MDKITLKNIKPGIYKAKRKTYNWHCSIIKIKGNIPFLHYSAWNMNTNQFTSGRNVFDDHKDLELLYELKANLR